MAILIFEGTEDGRLALTYQSYWARRIGQVRTDGIGKFILVADKRN